jgi:hypothetical protein
LASFQSNLARVAIQGEVAIKSGIVIGDECRHAFDSRLRFERVLGVKHSKAGQRGDHRQS